MLACPTPSPPPSSVHPSSSSQFSSSSLSPAGREDGPMTDASLDTRVCASSTSHPVLPSVHLCSTSVSVPRSLSSAASASSARPSSLSTSYPVSSPRPSSSASLVHWYAQQLGELEQRLKEQDQAHQRELRGLATSYQIQLALTARGTPSTKLLQLAFASLSSSSFSSSSLSSSLSSSSSRAAVSETLGEAERSLGSSRAPRTLAISSATGPKHHREAIDGDPGHSGVHTPRAGGEPPPAESASRSLPDKSVCSDLLSPTERAAKATRGAEERGEKHSRHSKDSPSSRKQSLKADEEEVGSKREGRLDMQMESEESREALFAEFFSFLQTEASSARCRHCAREIQLSAFRSHCLACPSRENSLGCKGREDSEKENHLLLPRPSDLDNSPVATCALFGRLPALHASAFSFLSQPQTSPAEEPVLPEDRTGSLLANAKPPLSPSFSSSPLDLSSSSLPSQSSSSSSSLSSSPSQSSSCSLSSSPSHSSPSSSSHSFFPSPSSSSSSCTSASSSAALVGCTDSPLRTGCAGVSCQAFFSPTLLHTLSFLLTATHPCVSRSAEREAEETAEKRETEEGRREESRERGQSRSEGIEGGETKPKPQTKGRREKAWHFHLPLSAFPIQAMHRHVQSPGKSGS